MSSVPLEGELTRHHDQPFYAQKQAPKFFWGGCLTPLVVLGLIGFIIFKSLDLLAAPRLFALITVLFIIGQLIFGLIVYSKTRSSLGKGVLLGVGVLLLSAIIVFMIAASGFTAARHFLH